MPQFDPHYFSSQIFWLTICFAILYYFVSNIILPRIRDILKERKSVVDSDTLQANQLDQAIDEISSKTVALRMKATKEYQAKLEEATKVASSKREKLTEELKEKIEIITKKSQEDLKNFIASTHAQSQLAIQDLTKNIKSKLFNIS